MVSKNTTSDIRMLSRDACLSARDQKAYWKLLKAACANVRCYIPPTAVTGKKPPALKLRRTLPAPGAHGIIEVVFDGKWQPRWKRLGYYKTWGIVNLPYPNVYFLQGGGLIPPRPPLREGGIGRPASIGTSEITFRYRSGDKKQRAFARRGLRLLEKIATNKIQGVEFPSLKVVKRYEKGSGLWLGEDVVRWCREEPARMIGFGYRVGFRPLD